MAQNAGRCSLNLPQPSPGLDQTTPWAACQHCQMEISWERVINPRRVGENHSREDTKESPRTAPSTVTAGKCTGNALQALPDVGWCRWKEYPVNLQKK